MKKVSLSLMLILVITLFSCEEKKSPEFIMCRANCLESSTVTYVRYSDRFMSIYQDGDTVWVNMNTHLIDDVDTTAQKCVLIQK